MFIAINEERNRYNWVAVAANGRIMHGEKRVTTLCSRAPCALLGAKWL